MTVTLKRFKALDQSFNLPMTSVKDSLPTEILNSGYNTVVSVSSDITNFLKNATGQLSLSGLRDTALSQLSGVKSALGLDQMSADFASLTDSSLIREARGLYKSVMDLTQLTPNAVERYISGVFSDNPAVASSIKSLATSCRTSALSNVTLGRVADKRITCQSGSSSSANRSCNVSSVNSIFNKLSGGTFGSAASDINLLLKRATTLANLGYDMNLCGVMGVVANGATDYLGRLVSIVLLEQASKGNTSAVLDISKTVAAYDDVSLLQSPYTLTEAFQNFKIPTGTTDSQIGSLSESYLAAMDTYDPTWRYGDDGTTLSTQVMGSTNDDFVSVISSSSMTHNVDESDLDFTDYEDITYLSSAYQGNNTDSLSELSAMW